MDILPILAVLLITITGSILLHWFRFRISSGRPVGLRPLPGYDALKLQSGRVVESGRVAHFSLGRGNLAGRTSPASIAALTALDFLTEDGCASDVPPLTTSGDGTLMLAAQDSLRGAFLTAGRPGEYDPQLARFLAGSEFAAAYAAGASDVVNSEKLGSNLLFGHYGPEVAVITEAADRKELEQVMGSDDPTAMALAIAVTEQVLIGEELFVAGAYLHGDPAQVAAVQLQDLMRVIAIVGILLAALFNLVVA